MDTARSRPLEPLRRRNGRPQACEPCRKRKVACDHAYPTCRRCKSRKSTAQCVYLVSSSTSSSRTPLSRSPSNSPRLGTETSSVTPRPSTETSAGYFGFTSFATIYQETQSSLKIIQGNSATPSSSPSASTSTDLGSVLSPRKLQKCIDVLRCLPDEESGLSFFEKDINPNSGWVRLAAQGLVQGLYEAFRAQLDSRSPHALQRMAEIISKNTAVPWVDEEADAERWISSFSGLNTRWECVGILFTYWFFGVSATEPQGPDISRGPNHPSTPNQKLMLVYKEVIEFCIDLCKGHEPNSLLLLLLYNRGIIESIISGETSSLTWRCHGDCIALATYLGLHADSSGSSSYVPTASSEARRRLIAQLYKIDKVAASFYGRPPLLNKKFLLTPLPLDLRDDELVSDRDNLKKAVDSLDENGWNTHGKVYPTTVLRARVLLAKVKDDIMEIALSNVKCSSVEDLLNLESQQFDTHAAFPSALHYSPDNIRDVSVDKVTLYAKILTHLEHLQNLFFIRRLLIQRGHMSSQTDLLRTGFEIVGLTLVFWTHMDRLTGLHGNLDCIVMAYAAPAGGILCNELLMPTLHLSPVSGLTRSSIIQRLSLLIGFLDWIGPSGPNGDVCSSYKSVMEHVLDHSLNTPMDLTSERGNMNDFALDFSSNLNNYFSFDLLDTFDWLRPEANTAQ